jgi:hypothetical protein
MRKIFKLALKQAKTDRTQKFLNSALAHPDLLDNFWKAIESVGVCAFSLNPLQTLMWSHYADHHRGVCVAYEFPAEFIQEQANEILGLDAVDYGPQSLTSFLADDNNTEMNKMLNGLIERYLTIKNKEWKYEEEARIIRGRKGLLEIPPNFIKQICFGMLTPSEDIAVVAKLAATGSGNVKFAKITRGRGVFGITMVPLDTTRVLRRVV